MMAPSKSENITQKSELLWGRKFCFTNKRCSGTNEFAP